MGLERNRYFTGKLLDAADLTQEQSYFLDKARRHNRIFHGWGIVCGLCVRPGAASCALIVEPGLALDGYGNEIVVDDEVTVDLCSEVDDANAVPNPGPALYLAIRYAECATHPVPAGDSTEYSRIRESFAIRLLKELPTSYRQQLPSEADSDLCPDSLTDPWVILAEVALDSNSKISKLDCTRHRRRTK